MARKIITVTHGQSIWDLALRHYGSVDGVQQLIADNPELLNFNNRPAAGTPIVIDEDKIINKKVVEFFDATRVLPPATSHVNVNNWLLADGVWNDKGVWVDSEKWYGN